MPAERTTNLSGFSELPPRSVLDLIDKGDDPVFLLGDFTAASSSEDPRRAAAISLHVDPTESSLVELVRLAVFDIAELVLGLEVLESARLVAR